MKKLFGYISIIAVIMIICILVSPLNTIADLGDFNDYDYGGGGNDYDYGGGYDSYDSDGYGGSGEDLTAGEWVIIMIITALLIWLVTKISIKTKKKGAPAASTQTIRDHTGEIIPAIMHIDPQFSGDKFIAWVKEVFFTLQYAWMERNSDKMRPFEKEELFQQHKMQIQQYIINGRINVLERININQAYMQKYVRDSEYEYLTVFLQVRMTDYIKDEKTGQVLKGSPSVDSHMKYLYTFMRKTGVLTNPASSNKSTTNCPHCGAPTSITSAGKCEYCESVVTTGVFDWVLSNIDGVKPHTVIDDSGVIIRDDRNDDDK